MNNTQVFWLILTAFLVALVARKVRVPYALALVVTGLGIGVSRALPHVRLDPTVLLTVFLPPLLFETAINLRVTPLKRDWFPITVYALLGTILSTFIIGCFTSRFLHIPLQYALVFGALISPTDPISVVAVFKRLGVGRRLKLVIEAESLFNDVTAVVLFSVMMSLIYGHKASAAAGCMQFVQLSLGGAVLGIALGMLATRVHFELDDHLVEIMLTTIVAYGSYLFAGLLHVSGVMAVITSGIVIGNYGMQRAMSPSTRLAVNAFWEYAGFVVNSLVFLLIGIQVTYVSWSDKWLFAGGATVIVLVGRAGVYPLSFIVNRFGSNIPASWQHVLFWGGLRGALSMALVLGLSPGFPYRDLLEAGTFAVVIFSLLVQGLSLGPLLSRLQLTSLPTSSGSGPDSAKIRRLAGEILGVEAALSEIERLRVTEAHSDWSVAVLARRYHDKLEALERQMTALQPEYAATKVRSSSLALRKTLSAEKAALHEAERQGWLEEEDWAEIARRIDAELVGIDLAGGS